MAEWREGMNRRDFFKVALGGTLGIVLAPMAFVKASAKIERDCCMRCGKKLRSKNGDSFYSGIRFGLKHIDASPENEELARENWGKYYGQNVTYDFCFECWIDSLMGV